jgi:hypothetical protein
MSTDDGTKTKKNRLSGYETASSAEDSASMFKLILAKIDTINALDCHQSLPMASAANLP